MFCYSPKHCFRLIEGQQYHFWSEKSPVVGLEPQTLHRPSTEPCYIKSNATSKIFDPIVSRFDIIEIKRSSFWRWPRLNLVFPFSIFIFLQKNLLEVLISITLGELPSILFQSTTNMHTQGCRALQGCHHLTKMWEFQKMLLGHPPKNEWMIIFFLTFQLNFDDFLLNF